MSCRRKRQRPIPGHNDRHAANNVEQLTFKYMMCKMESSTDSDSEISPRWSDTSTMGCVSSAPESNSSRRALSLTHKLCNRHGFHSLFLDPYDGSSEDSDESIMEGDFSIKPARPRMKSGGCRLLARSRRLMTFHQPASVTLKETKDSASEHHDVQMKCGSESEPLDTDGCRNPPEDSASHIGMVDVDLLLNHSRSSVIPVKEESKQTLCSSSQRSHSPCDFRCVYKRKLGLTAEDMMEMKRLCVVDRVGPDSASTPG